MLLQTDSYQSFLANELSRRIRTNSRYSLRAFAKQLQMSPGELSEILKGKRPLTLKAAMKLSAGLGLSPAETHHLLGLVQAEKARSLGQEHLLKNRVEDLQSVQLSLELFAVISDWHHFAIVNLFSCAGFSADPKWISRRLGINPVEAMSALERLERVGVLTRRHGKLAVSADFVLSPSDVPSEAVRNYHRQILEKAIRALDEQSVDEREISGLGMSIDPRTLPAIKKEIHQFMKSIIGKYSVKAPKGTEVYHLECALFRLTQPKDKGTK